MCFLAWFGGSSSLHLSYGHFALNKLKDSFTASRNSDHTGRATVAKRLDKRGVGILEITDLLPGPG